MKRRLYVSTLVVALTLSPLGIGELAFAAAPADVGGTGLQMTKPAITTVTAETAKPMLVAKKFKRFRKPPRRHRRSHKGINNGIAIGLGIAILGLIAASTAKSSGYRNAVRRCRAEYNSFDEHSGTYVTYGGDVRLCPYLEPYVD